MVRQDGCYSLVEVGWAAAAIAVPEEEAEAIANVLGVVAAIVLEAEGDMAAVRENIAVDVASERRSLAGVVRSGQWGEDCAFC